MKLLNCLKCHDIIALRLNVLRKCFCGISEGKYIDQKNVQIKGPARVIGMDNYEYILSLTVNIVPFKTYYRWFPIISRLDQGVELVDNWENNDNNQKPNNDKNNNQKPNSDNKSNENQKTK